QFDSLPLLKQIPPIPQEGAQMTERLETPMSNPSELFGKVVEYLLVAGLGWFISNFSQQRKFEEFEKRVISPIRDEVAVFKGAMATFATREELRSEIASLRGDVKEGFVEVKQLIRELRTGQ